MYTHNTDLGESIGDKGAQQIATALKVNATLDILGTPLVRCRQQHRRHRGSSTGRHAQRQQDIDISML